MKKESGREKALRELGLKIAVSGLKERSDIGSRKDSRIDLNNRKVDI